MRRLPLVLAVAAFVAVLMTSCDTDQPIGVPVTQLPSGSILPSVTTQPSVPASQSATASPSPDLPAGVPVSYDLDVRKEDVPSKALIPPGTKVSNRWMTETPGGEVIVVAYLTPSGDPFLQARGLVEWRRTEGSVPPWSPVFGMEHRKSEGILGVEGLVGDATGDGSVDLLLLESTGGSGVCGNWRVIDLAAASERWVRSLCDGRVDLHVDPVGIALLEAVYGPEDPHCCPSGFRTTVLVYQEGRGFVKDSVQSTPA
ncbi:MAG: hypothetical protein WBM72_06440 [Actinomycetota bacterium]